MKSYPIPSPNTLRQAAEGIKWDRDYRNVMGFADEWERSGASEAVLLELGKGAQIVRVRHNSKAVLATMYVAAAKDFVKGLSEA